MVKKSLVDGASSTVNYVGKTADDLRKLDKEKLKEDAYTGWSLGSHRMKELLGREKDVTEGPDELADLTRTGRDWATLLANASKCKGVLSIVPLKIHCNPWSLFDRCAREAMQVRGRFRDAPGRYW